MRTPIDYLPAGCRRTCLEGMRVGERAVPHPTIATTFLTLRNGKRLYAASYGLKAWRLLVRKK